jgi:hypothetical protein
MPKVLSNQMRGRVVPILGKYNYCILYVWAVECALVKHEVLPKRRRLQGSDIALYILSHLNALQLKKSTELWAHGCIDAPRSGVIETTHD